MKVTALQEDVERRRVAYSVFECLDAAGECWWQPGSSVATSETVYLIGE